MVPTLVLTRHGLTTRSNPEQHLGQTIDVPLSPDGRVQAAALGERLAPVSFDRVVSSPLIRARETAEAIRMTPDASPRPPLEIDRRLLEMDYGAWEGLTYDQIDAADAATRRLWEEDPDRLACPNGESGNDVAARAGRFLADLLATPNGDAQVLAVAHSTLNRILVCVALGIPVRDFRRRIVQSQVNLTVLRWTSGARPSEAEVLLLNDVAHVRRPPATPWE